jgi:hypothetical protein
MPLGALSLDALEALASRFARYVDLIVSKTHSCDRPI